MTFPPPSEAAASPRAALFHPAVARALADTLDWPFFDPAHRELQETLGRFLGEDPHALPEPLSPHAPQAQLDAHCRDWVQALGEGGWLRFAVGGIAYGGAAEALDTRTVCLLRETLAAHDGLADFAFAMQGLGSGAITLAGTPALKDRYLPRVARGQAIAAFALSEPDAGSDVAALRTTARRDGRHWVLDGEKTWISNGGIADFYVVFARQVEPGATPEARGTGSIAAFVVDAASAGLEIAERLESLAPHPLARLVFRECRIPATQCLAEAGAGFKLAMRTLDIFRSSMAAAALGFSRRALSEALLRATTRPLFGQYLSELQLTQARLADMALAVDSAALLTYRAAWRRDNGHPVTSEAAMAKLAATEGAQRVVDAALQLWGGAGVRSGAVVERLYRDVRALRIYEGASEIQQLIIAKKMLDR